MTEKASSVTAVKPEKLDTMGAIKRVATQVRRDDVTGLSAELAYRAFLSLFPFFIFLGAVGNTLAQWLGVGNPVDQLSEMLGSSLPPAAAPLVRDVIRATLTTSSGSLLSLSVLAAVLIATGGMNALIKAMNRAYDVRETRPFWRRYLIALGLTLLAAPTIITAFLILVAGETAMSQVAIGSGLGDEVQGILRVARLPIAALLILAVAAVLYRLTPNLKLPVTWLTAGAAVFAIGFMVATYLFGLYVSHFNSYSNVYGVLAGVAILLIWLYIAAFILLVGAEVNSVVDEQMEPEKMDEERRRSEAAGERESADTWRRAA